MEKVFWVLGRGLDRDGYNNGDVHVFANKKRAESFCEELNKGSDGIIYIVTDSLEDLKEYCEHFGENINNCLSVGGSVVSVVLTTNVILKENQVTELEVIIGINGDDENGYGWVELYDTETGGKDFWLDVMIEVEDKKILGYERVFTFLPAIVDKLKELGYDVSEVE